MENRLSLIKFAVPHFLSTTLNNIFFTFDKVELEHMEGFITSFLKTLVEPFS